MKAIDKLAVYVGIPATTPADRANQLLDIAIGKVKSAKRNKSGKLGVRKDKLTRLANAAASTSVNNAELLFIFSKGSPIRNQDPRPVLEPAIEADGNRQPIAAELGKSMQFALEGQRDRSITYLKRAGVAGQNAARAWFTDPRNNWAPNAESTIRAKGSDRPGIDFGLMRGAIVWVLKAEE